MRQGSWHRRAAELVLVGASLFLPLELSARLYLFGWPGLVPERINSVHEITQADLVRPSSDSRLGFELKPDLDTYFKLARFRTNSRGLRDAEYGFPKPANTRRVAVLGSSFALPSGVEIEDAFHSRLERELSSRPGGPQWEFINFAVGMYGPRQMLAMLETRALEYEPDLILITATTQSVPLFLEPPAPEAKLRPAPLPVFETTYPILQSFLVRLVEQRRSATPAQLHVGYLERCFMDWVQTRSPDRGAGNGERGGRSESLSPATALDVPVIERLAAIRERMGIPIVVVRLEIDPSDPTPIERALADRCRALGLHYVDTRAGFRGSRPSDFWIYPLDPHPNARAHEIFAREISRFLDSEGLVSASRDS